MGFERLLPPELFSSGQPVRHRHKFHLFIVSSHALCAIFRHFLPFLLTPSCARGPECFELKTICQSSALPQAHVQPATYCTETRRKLPQTEYQFNYGPKIQSGQRKLCVSSLTLAGFCPVLILFMFSCLSLYLVYFHLDSAGCLLRSPTLSLVYSLNLDSIQIIQKKMFKLNKC